MGISDSQATLDTDPHDKQFPSAIIMASRGGSRGGSLGS